MLKRTDNAAVANKEVSAAVNIPYKIHLTDDILLTEDGDLVRCYKLTPTAVDTADDSDINAWSQRRHNMLKAVKNSAVSYWTHVVKRKGDFRSKKVPAGIAGVILENYENKVIKDEMYTTEFYFSVVYRPGKTGVKILDFLKRAAKKKSHSTNELKAQYKKSIHKFDDICKGILGQLNTLYEPKALGCYKKNDLTYSKCLQFLSYLVDGEWREVAVYPAPIKYYLSKNWIDHGHDTGCVTKSNGDETFHSMLGIRQYVGSSNPLVLDDVIRHPAELVISQSFSNMTKAEALEAIKRQRNHLIATEEDATRLVNELEDAIEQLAAGEFGMGHHNLSIMVKSSNQKTLGDISSAIAPEVIGHEVVREDLAMESAFWAMLPGNFSYIPRNSDITTLNFADFSSFHGFPTGAESSKWGEPLLTLKTDSVTPYWLHLLVDELGHTTFIGPSRSGKTTWMTLIMMAHEKYGDVEHIFFDKDLGAETAVRALNGRYNIIRQGISTGFNPFQLDDTPVNRAFLLNLLRQCVMVTGVELTNEDIKDLNKAIDQTYALDKHMRKLNVAYGFLERKPDSKLLSALELWTLGGSLGWVFDNDTDEMNMDGRIFGYDMTEILENKEAKGPISNYIIFRHKQKLDGRKTLFYFDEGRSLLEDEFWEGEIEDLELTIGKSNGITLFATQMPEHMLSSDTGRVVLEQSATNIFAGNPKARREDYIQGFHLTEREFQIVKEKLPGTRSYLIKKRGQLTTGSSNGESVVVDLDLAPIRDLIPLLSNKKAYVDIYRSLIELHGDDPQLWVPHFLDKVNNA